jgi:hypothetical protein
MVGKAGQDPKFTSNLSTSSSAWAKSSIFP